MKETTDIIVIGAGVVGLTTALLLCQRGFKVQILESNLIEGKSSWAGAGIISPLLPWDYSIAVNNLALPGMQSWPAMAQTLKDLSGMDPEFWECGMEVLCTDSNQLPSIHPIPAGRQGELDAALAWCKMHGLSAERKPGGRLWLPNVSQVRNPRLVAALFGSVRNLGGRILDDCKINSLKTQSREVIAARAEKTEHKADVFVLAAGAWSGLPLGAFASVPNIRPVRGQMLLYAPGSHTLKHILYRDGLYLVPRRDGHLLAGSTLENVGFDPATTREALARLHESACGLLPELCRQSPINSWSGLRPGSPDNIPVIDRHPDFDNLWIHTGHFRYGVTMAPASSQLLAELMLGETPFVDPAPYSWQAALARNWPGGKPC